ncbi:MAG: 50S ribosomal protein L32 [Endozoicomonadaceae bacterium]|nr:50S ribosomal protein L32 [Endozoicomonadaceae bacterium]
MAVHKKHVTRSKRDMRRAHDALSENQLSIDERGEVHQRHHVTPHGFFKGRKISQ